MIFPYRAGAPAYFASKIQLGAMMQTARAFGQVQDALSFFVVGYRSHGRMARGGRAARRLRDVDRQRAAHAAGAEASTARPDGGGSRLDLEKLLVHLPNGTPLVAADGFAIRAGERVLVTGPSGSGKSTLFRAIAGIWPFGRGTIAIPAKATLMMLPQRPYFPIAPLRDGVTYPGAAGAFQRGADPDVLNAVGLPDLAERLDEDDALEPDAVARRAAAARPRPRAAAGAATILFLDEATASLDEPSEAALYRLLQQKLPRPTIVSIGHRSTLDAFHPRNVAMATARRPLGTDGPGGAREAARPRPSVWKETPAFRGLPSTRDQSKGRQIALPPSSDRGSPKAYFRLVIAVRSTDSLAIPAAPHQLEPKPPGLIEVTLAGLKLVVE